jgi:hypothetical protein
VRVIKGKADWKIKNITYTAEKNDIVILSNIETRQFTKIYPPDDFEYEVFYFHTTELI